MLRRYVLVGLLAATCHAMFAADQPPIEVASPHFVLITDGGEKQARHTLDNFERMRWMFHTLFPKANVDPPAPILVLAMKNKKGFQALEPQQYLAKGQLELAGLFLGGPEKNYVLLRLDPEGEHPFATVYHEYTHLQFRSAGEWMPLWLNEGIAEFFQNTDFLEKEVLLGEPNADDILYLRQNQILPLETLFRVDHNSPYYHEENKGSVFYAESWALTHYLQVSDREKGTHRVSDYLQRMSQHEDPVTAAQAAFGDLKQLQNQLRSYIQQQQYKEFKLSSAAAAIDSNAYKVRTLSRTEYDADRGDFLAYVGRTEEARSLLQSVMTADPRNAQARESMGYLEFRAGNQAAARKWYEEAVQLDSQSYLAHYYFAMMSMSATGYTDDPRIETSLRSSIRLNPGFAPAYDQLAGWFANRHEHLDEAQTLSLKAVELDRSNLGFRLNNANLQMMRDNFDAAERVLNAARPLCKNPQELAMVTDRIEQIASIKAIRDKAKSEPGVTVSADGVIRSVPSEGTEDSNREIVIVEPPPRHPVEPATGPKHSVLGVLTAVQCFYPTYLEMQMVVNGKSKPIALYTSDFSHLELTALGFTPKSIMDPCHELATMKAKVVYAESSDKTIDGQIVAIELHK